ncbi:mechanosensitive ion channel [candidate division WOR-3 bacterium]|nr:mechanosensitive ion channel [candidate division WOR-3 bacterium]
MLFSFLTLKIAATFIGWFVLELLMAKTFKHRFLLKNKFFIHALVFFLFLWLLSLVLSDLIFPARIGIILGNLFSGAVLVIGSYLLADLADFFLSGQTHYKGQSARIIPGVLRNIIKFVLVVIFVLLILHFHFKMELKGISVTSAVLAGVLGFALQETLGNLLSGIALNMESPFKHGDWIKVGEEEGWVIDITWRSTTIHTRQDDLITIPNSKVSSEKIINFSRPQRNKAVEINVGVSYENSPEKVKNIIIQCALESKLAKKEPRPLCWLTNYGDSSINYKLKFWIKDYAEIHQAQDEVMTKIWYSFKRNSIDIPFPIRQIKNYESHAASVEIRIQETVETLKRIAIFEPLESEDIMLLAKNSPRVSYGQGDIIIRQEDEGDSMFIITKGEVVVEKKGEDGSHKFVAKLGPLDFVGEMSLLTGERRSATVKAFTEVEVILINKNAFKQILVANPKIAFSLSEKLLGRKKELERLGDPKYSELDSVHDEKEKTSILMKIQGFFGITRK